MLDDRETVEPKKSSVQAFRRGNKKPLLTAEEEIRLAQRWQEDRDVDARNRLVESFFSWGTTQASKIAATIGKSQEYSASWASDGLMHAVEGFDINRGLRFSTYAFYCIRTQVKNDSNGYDYVNRRQTAGVPKTIVNHFVKAREGVEREARLQGDTLTTHEIHERMAALFRVPVKTITNYAIARQGYKSLNEPQRNDESGSRELGDTLEAGELDPSDITDIENRRDTFGQAVANLKELKRGGLKPRDVEVLRLRFFEEKTLEETAIAVSKPGEKPLTNERIRQLEVRALEKIMDEMAQIAAITIDTESVLIALGRKRSTSKAKQAAPS